MVLKSENLAWKHKIFCYLISVDTNSDHITANEDYNNSDEEHGHLPVSPLPLGYPAVPHGDHADLSVHLGVKDGDQQERE